MLDSYGYPGSDMVGEEGAHHFWLLVQHLDKWPAFQQQVIKAMEQQVADKKAFSQRPGVFNRPCAAEYRR